MSKFRGAHYLVGVALLFGVCGGLFGAQSAAFAETGSSPDATVLSPFQEGDVPVAEDVTVSARYPILQNVVGSSFSFEVTLYYQAPEGSDARTFDLSFEAPEGWTGRFTGDSSSISAVTIEPGETSRTIDFVATPPTNVDVNPGNYEFAVNAASDDVTGSVGLEAVVVPESLLYVVFFNSPALTTDYTVNPGQDNHVAMQLINGSNGTVSDILFSAKAPEGWDISFTPASITELEGKVTQEIDVIIRPPKDAEPGDYPLMLDAVGDRADDDYSIRLTVPSSSIGGMVGAIVAIAVIVFLAIWFRRSGKR